MSPEELVRRSTFIVRATALGYYRPPTLERIGRPAAAARPSIVRFRVDKVLKGHLSDAIIELDGEIVPKHDVKETAVPYRTTRKPNNEFVTGREYLLMMRDGANGYDVAWAAPSPSSEPIRGDDDAWLKWVSERASKESH
jgi:hypothetical protein